MKLYEVFSRTIDVEDHEIDNINNCFLLTLIIEFF